MGFEDGRELLVALAPRVRPAAEVELPDSVEVRELLGARVRAVFPRDDRPLLHHSVVEPVVSVHRPEGARAS